MRPGTAERVFGRMGWECCGLNRSWRLIGLTSERREGQDERP
jgi:hypothetical protein